MTVPLEKWDRNRRRSSLTFLAGATAAEVVLIVLPIAAYLIYAYWNLHQAEEAPVEERKALCLAKLCLKLPLKR